VLTLPRHVRVFVAMAPFDMRGSFDAMAGRVRLLGLEPVDGNLYLFVSRRRRMAAVLYFDGSGWCLFRKRLEAGTFQLPEVGPGCERVAVDVRVLAAILDGIDLRAPRRRWYEPRPTAQSQGGKIPSREGIDTRARA
jgi:transposase